MTHPKPSHILLAAIATLCVVPAAAQPPQTPPPANLTLTGWIDADSATGRMKVESRADGQWTATRRR